MYRNKQLLEIVRKSPCQHCGIEDGSVVAAHANLLRLGKAKGMKCHDCYISALCFKCHFILDQGKDLSKSEREEMWIESYLKTMKWLFENNLLSVKSY